MCHGTELEDEFKTTFHTVRRIKPEASRKQSAEIFILARDLIRKSDNESI